MHMIANVSQVSHNTILLFGFEGQLWRDSLHATKQQHVVIIILQAHQWGTALYAWNEMEFLLYRNEITTLNVIERRIILCFCEVLWSYINTSRPVGSVERCSPVDYIGKRSLKQLQGNNLWYHFKRVHILWSFKQWFPTSDVAAREVPNGCKIQEKNIKGKSFIIISIPLNLKCSYL